MTDTLCGPSNALQNFQKHTTVDRSLQHDRLTSRHASAQGFRSQFNGNAGLLDHEFEAFQAGIQPPFPHEQQAGPQLPHQQYYQDPFGPRQQNATTFQLQHHFQERPEIQSQAPGGWASDFQKMQSAFPSQTQMQQTHVQHPAQSSWHQDFQAQPQFNSKSFYTQQQPSPHYAYNSSSTSIMNMQRPYGYMPSESAYGQSSEARWKGKGKWQAEALQDLAAFEREFEALSTEQSPQQVQDKPLEKTAELGQDVHVSESTMELPSHDQDVFKHSFIRLPGNKFIGDYQPSHQQPLRNPDTVHVSFQDHNADEQARRPSGTDEEMRATARRVVEHVKDETSEKFVNSEFFSFMRQIRDGEKQVKDDQVIDVDPALAQPQDASVMSSALPPQQQDADLGRNYQMAGFASHAATTRKALVARTADEMGLSKAVADAWLQQSDYMRPGGHPVDDF